MSRSFELPEADWATVGAVGTPGQRTFYLQARQDEQLVTLKVEKGQVAAIAAFLTEILADLPAPESPSAPARNALVEPTLAEWAVGGVQLSYDPGSDRIVLLVEELVIGEGDEDDVEPDPAVARIGISRATAASIVRTGSELVSAGRATCELCGRPMDPEGHACPRTNGHRPH